MHRLIDAIHTAGPMYRHTDFVIAQKVVNFRFGLILVLRWSIQLWAWPVTAGEIVEM